MNTMGTFSDLSLALPNQSGEVTSKSYDSQEVTQQLSVQVADNLPAIEALRPIWTKWTHNLNTDLDYYLDNLNSDSTILQPYVITVSQGGIPQAMLVGQVRQCRVSTVISSVNIRGPKAKVLEVITGGRMGRQSAAIDQLLVLQLRDALREGSVDLLCFQRLPLQSDLFREIQEVPGLLMKHRVPHVFCYSVVPLTAPQGKRPRALAGKNRREARRKARILQRAFPGKARSHCFSDPTELEAGLRDAAAVRLSTWQHHLDGCTPGTVYDGEKLAFCARQGWLRIYVMYVEEAPVAFLIGQCYQRTFYCQHAGYRSDFARYSVGSLLTTWAFESLAATGVEQADLGEGGQEHNRRLGCRVYEEGTVHLYSPTLRGLCVNLFFAAAQAVRTGGRHARERLQATRPNGEWSRFLPARWRIQRNASKPRSEATTTA
jgi:Acetyltransferase (GNAT) domain